MVFRIGTKQVEKGTALLTSNFPLGQGDQAFAGDTTLAAGLLERLLHHAHGIRIEAEGYRLNGKRMPGSIGTRQPVDNSQVG